MKIKKLSLLVIVCIMLVVGVGASVSAFDQCSFYGYDKAFSSQWYSYAKAYMYPWGDTYPHAHQAVAREYNSLGDLLVTGYSAYDEGPVQALTNTVYDGALNNFAYGYAICPMWP